MYAILQRGMKKMPNNNINNELKRNLSETYNYTMGAASNAVTSLIGAPIVIAAIFKNSSFNER